jgi:3-dehydroquinate dehydratase-1
MTNAPAPQIVGVIFSRADLQRALRLRNPPDLFELRLDALRGLWPRHPADGTWDGSPCHENLRAPWIITARHPREGGANELPLRQRRELLVRFLPDAACLDIELRSARALTPLLEQAQAKKITTILSFHDFTTTPSRARLQAMARAAHSLGADIFKIATRTDTRPDLQRLLDLLELQSAKMKIAVMGVGRLGSISRIESARRGSALSYVHLGTPRPAGQLSLTQMRRVIEEI